MSKKYIEIDLDKINYSGDSENEKRLNKMLLQTTLELNYFQDSYDCMKTVDEIKNRIKNRKEIIKSLKNSISQDELLKYETEIDTLKWVLNGSHTIEEKEQKLPRASKEDVQRILEDIKNKLEE